MEGGPRRHDPVRRGLLPKCPGFERLVEEKRLKARRFRQPHLPLRPSHAVWPALKTLRPAPEARLRHPVDLSWRESPAPKRLRGVPVMVEVPLAGLPVRWHRRALAMENP